MPLRRRHDRKHPAPDIRPAVDPSWGIPPAFDAAADVVDAASSSTRRNAVALVHVAADGTIDRCTFAEIGRLGARWARFIGPRTPPGSLVLVALHPGTTWAAILLGCMRAGVIAMPVETEISSEGLADRVMQAQPSLVLHDARFADVVAGAAHALPGVPLIDVDDAHAALGTQGGILPPRDHSALDPALLVFTRGRSTGRPRPVVHAHAAAHAAGTGLREWLEVAQGDLVWCDALAGSATSTLLGLFGAWHLGASVLKVDAGIHGRDLVAVIERVEPTLALVSAERLGRVLHLQEALGGSFPRLQRIGSTDGPLDREVAERLEAMAGVRVLDGYSTTEMGLVACTRPGDPPGSPAVGSPVSGVLLEPVDASGYVLDVGVQGDLAVYGRMPSLCLGYWDGAPPRPEPDSDWWTLTGDRGAVDQDGRIHLDAPPPLPPAESAGSRGKSSAAKTLSREA